MNWVGVPRNAYIKIPLKSDERVTERATWPFSYSDGLEPWKLVKKIL